MIARKMFRQLSLVLAALGIYVASFVTIFRVYRPTATPPPLPPVAGRRPEFSSIFFPNWVIATPPAPPFRLFKLEYAPRSNIQPRFFFFFSFSSTVCRARKRYIGLIVQRHERILPLDVGEGKEKEKDKCRASVVVSKYYFTEFVSPRFSRSIFQTERTQS